MPVMTLNSLHVDTLQEYLLVHEIGMDVLFEWADVRNTSGNATEAGSRLDDVTSWKRDLYFEHIADHVLTPLPWWERFIDWLCG